MGVLRQHAPLISGFQRILDILILVGITALVGQKYGGPPDLIRGFAIHGSILTIVIFSALGMYRSWREQTIWVLLRRLVFAWLLVLVAFNVLVLLVANKQQLAILWPFALVKTQIFQVWAAYLFVGLATVRIFTRGLLQSVRKRGFNTRRAAIVGAGIAGQKIGSYLASNPWMGIRLEGFFDDFFDSDNPVFLTEDAFVPILGRVSDCIEYAMGKQIDFVFVALPMKEQEQINDIIWSLGTKGVTIFLAPDLFTLGIQRAKIRYTGDLPLLDVNLFPAWKRSFDVVFSILVILLTFPLWLIIAIAIKLEDGGPILYGHSRVMESGKSFDCLKFRTMHLDADKRLKELLESSPDRQKEWEETYKLKDDPRVTKMGKFLRKTSLDELPQFINVLAGQMSVVGARPIVTEELEKYYKDIALTYCAMKPGITGPWQVGDRNDTVDYQERVDLDRRYVLSCSLWVDIKIILKTILRVIRPKGAY